LKKILYVYYTKNYMASKWSNANEHTKKKRHHKLASYTMNKERKLKF